MNRKKTVNGINNEISTLKQQIIKKGTKGLALDIDETIAQTAKYWIAQLQKYVGNPENLSVQEIIAKYRYPQNAPYWQTENAMALMDKYRNSNETQEIIPVVKDANTTVQKINAITPIVFYISTRPETILDGTTKWLQKHHFPKATIITRPKDVHFTQGNQWKAEVLEYLYPQITGIIDDNPELVNQLSSKYKGTVFLYDNSDHPRKDLTVIPCKTWHNVLEKVKESKIWE